MTAQGVDVFTRELQSIAQSEGAKLIDIVKNVDCLDHSVSNDHRLTVKFQREIMKSGKL